jgi:hypothetical protein
MRTALIVIASVLIGGLGSWLAGRFASSAVEPNVAAGSTEAALLRVFATDGAPVAESQRFREEIIKSINSQSQASRLRPGADVTVEQLECRFRVCKMTLLFDSTEADIRIVDRAFALYASDQYPKGLGAFAAPARSHLANGAVRTTLFVAREGDL